MQNVHLPCSSFSQLPLAVLSIVIPQEGISIVEAFGVCIHVTVQVSFTYQSTILPRKTPMQNQSENMLFRLCAGFL